ncbi:MAG: protein kinase [Lysobacterales bacterium]
MPGPNDPAYTAAVLRTEGATEQRDGPLPQAASADEPEIGWRAGPWQLLRLLGRGGMGAVYLAERVEHDFQQRAALKLIKLGMDSEEIQRRFVSERRILARLEHPNIARLIDGGVDARGRPYFVMEWVDGPPLIEYADQQQLDVRARLRLFLKLCEAVSHAHRQLVVHRDLKPGNILVNSRGEPKLLDFGIAKLLQSDTDKDTSATGARFFTRAYAAPEQIRGEPVSTATDVYALGAVLFELLTGMALHRARALVQETRELLVRARRQAGEDGPAAITPRMLAGDLALVLTKAVRDEPNRRYASVEALADDIRAYLDGRPVRARPDSLGYRSRRFLRRHWIGVLASTAVLVAIVIGSGLALWQARIAREEALRAEAVSAFLSSVFQSATPEGAAGSDITARSLLERGGQRIELELAGQPAVQARLYATLGRAWFYIGDSARAATLLEAGRARVDPQDWRTQTALLRDLAQAELAAGKIDLARTHVDQALSVVDPGAADSELQQARVLSVSKSVYGAEGRYDQALALARQVHDTLRSLLGADAEETLQALNDLGTWTLESGDAAQALSIFDRVIAGRRASSTPDHPEMATAMHNRQLALFRLRRIDEALVEARAVVELRRRILPPNHRDLARSLGSLATIESSLGELEEARALRREGIDMLRAQKSPDQLLLGQELTNQGVDDYRLADLDSAARDLREAIERLQPQLGAEHARVLSARSYLALVQIYRGELIEAERELRLISAIEDNQERGGISQRLATRRYLARALRWQGRTAEANQILEDSAGWLDDPGLKVSPTARARTHLEWALGLIDTGQLSAAREQIEQARATGAGSEDGAVADRAQLLQTEARLALARSDWATARTAAEAALKLIRSEFEDGHWEIAEASALLALARFRENAGASQRADLRQLLEWHEQHRPWHPDTDKLRDALRTTVPPAPLRRQTP